MKTRRRLFYFFYILLNILVSAVVTGSILYNYHRTYPATCVNPLPQVTAAPDSASAEILSIGGAGTAASEVVTLQNDSQIAVTLTGWMLKDNQGTTFTFPEVTLFPGALLKVHTLAGKNTASDLYWGLSAPVWKAGELAGLYDPQNIVRSFYRIP